MNGGQKVVKIFALIFGIVLAFSIISSCVIVIFKLTQIVDFSSDNSKIEENFEQVVKVYKEDNEYEFNNIKISLSSVELYIYQGDYENLEYKCNTELIEKSIKNGTLNIEQKDSGKIRIVTGNDKNYKLYLYIPKAINIDKLKLITGASKVYINGLEVEEFDAKFGAGKTVIDNFSASRAKILTGVGSVVMNSMKIGKLDLDTGVGSVEYSGYILDDSKVSSGVGKLKLNIAGSYINYDLDVDKGIGSINLNEGNNNKKDILDKEIKLKIDSGIGSIYINFE